MEWHEAELCLFPLNTPHMKTKLSSFISEQLGNFEGWLICQMLFGKRLTNNINLLWRLSAVAEGRMSPQ